MYCTVNWMHSYYTYHHTRNLPSRGLSEMYLPNSYDKPCVSLMLSSSNNNLHGYRFPTCTDIHLESPMESTVKLYTT